MDPTISVPIANAKKDVGRNENHEQRIGMRFMVMYVSQMKAKHCRQDQEILGSARSPRFHLFRMPNDSADIFMCFAKKC